MIIHIGTGHSVDFDDIIAVLDADTSTVSKVTRDFLKRAQSENRVVTFSGDLPKSFVLTGKARKPGGKKSFVRLIPSPVASATIDGRTKRSY